MPSVGTFFKRGDVTTGCGAWPTVPMVHRFGSGLDEPMAGAEPLVRVGGFTELVVPAVDLAPYTCLRLRLRRP